MKKDEIRRYRRAVIVLPISPWSTNKAIKCFEACERFNISVNNHKFAPNCISATGFVMSWHYVSSIKLNRTRLVFIFLKLIVMRVRKS